MSYGVLRIPKVHKLTRKLQLSAGNIISDIDVKWNLK
jgi:hypothetical protein